ncbi:hypothetical protein PMZ80_000380 [Knufia obscura]|uniref:BZIP domain-containing protein n=2 Tax=Knufia TaxID=430999 RepID=A0AAN8IR32_9EURO|nr:hypothetical protein PMZ80_000380 [Knufia obscura]KAK5956692.1 hypothetical protein OHC33_002178 [Knufia fluminis]
MSSAPPSPGALERQTLRNRANQRNFRSRRQEYVKDLEAQVRAYQEKEILATKQMQVAARAVAAENSLLRELLKSQLGRDDHDIDVLLAHMRGDSSAPRCSHQVEMGSEYTAAETNQSSHQHRSWRPNTTATSTNSNSNIIPESISSHPAPPSTATLPRPLQTSTPAPTPRCPTPKDSISCEEAATIISGLRLQHEDIIREELGCNSARSCEIKNLAVLQMMSETF